LLGLLKGRTDMGNKHHISIVNLHYLNWFNKGRNYILSCFSFRKTPFSLFIFLSSIF